MTLKAYWTGQDIAECADLIAAHGPDEAVRLAIGAHQASADCSPDEVECYRAEDADQYVHSPGLMQITREQWRLAGGNFNDGCACDTCGLFGIPEVESTHVCYDCYQCAECGCQCEPSP